MTLQLAVMASGRGSNLQAVIEAIDAGRLDAHVVMVLANKADAYALTRAKERGIPAVFLDPKAYGTREDYDRAAAAQLRQAGAEALLLAGYMRIVTASLINAFAGRVLNIHPSLLPSFPGLHAQRQALDYGVRYSGCTVHFVDEGLDSGPIICQAVVPVEPGDTEATLAARILTEEHRILPEALQLIAQGRVTVTGRRVEIQPAQ
ncbi:phosphoribosylglycinamide formyltransferase [Heliophilum fasciatum]|uniref:Phosphoribosylglycinamide formyltransferase n=1 Tax=Heliophilum fasciatum TaxID=35700 RepID=A0A4R2RG69_9FIRM|nr:phosphoribosylglycinamide formyltransferase [Heliophilum fasciatum]MCW2278636.1 phosphoribosylglycinamide formyltransferase-1 [Heliophilum fasciatum]TCP62662.1 phosphoribosylglycinamide formyltransferase-1 [Heliophilum fasciatum]